MNEKESKNTSRRGFLRNTGRIASSSVLAAGVIPGLYAAENNTIKVAVVGCGGRGTGAARQAISVKNGPVKLVALADVFGERVSSSYKALQDSLSQPLAWHYLAVASACTSTSITTTSITLYRLSHFISSSEERDSWKIAQRPGSRTRAWRSLVRRKRLESASVCILIAETFTREK